MVIDIRGVSLTLHSNKLGANDTPRPDVSGANFPHIALEVIGFRSVVARSIINCFTLLSGSNL